jgi:hypothetical protein
MPLIPGMNGSYDFAGSTCGAVDDYSWRCGATDDEAEGPDVFYRLVLSSRKRVTLDTTGSWFDAMLFVRAVPFSCPGMPVACDDDSAGGVPAQARIADVTLDPGTYYVVVDSTSASSYGSFELHVTIGDPVVDTSNDLCAAAILLTPTSALQTIAGDTTAATDDDTACAGAAGAPDVWYTFTLAAPEAVFLSTVDGYGWNSVLTVHSDSCAGPLTSYGCANDACLGVRSMFVGILPAGTYYVAVDGVPGAVGDRGPFTLSYQGDTCVDALDSDPATPTRLDPLRAGTYFGSTVGRGDHSVGQCMRVGTQTAPDLYYYYALCPGRALSLSSCSSATDFDTVVYTRSGTCRPSPGWFTDNSCNNDGFSTCSYSPPGSRFSALGLGMVNQGLFYVFVDGYMGSASGLPSEGSYGLIVTE